MFKIVSAAVFCIASTSSNALEKKDFVGTWKLVSSAKRILETNEVVSSYGEHPVGWINYGNDDRMMVITAYDGRERIESVDKITDQDKIKLFNTFFAYAGTYKIEGNSVIHDIDTSWNESFTGTTKIRDVEVKGNELVYTTRPQMGGDGRMVVITLIWEKWP